MVSLGAVAALFLIGGRANAIDFYEIQIYPTETTPEGVLELELHSNSVTTASGAEAHQQLNPYQIHETLEATYGLTPHIEIGQYFATAKPSATAITNMPAAAPAPFRRGRLQTHGHCRSAGTLNWITCAAPPRKIPSRSNCGRSSKNAGANSSLVGNSSLLRSRSGVRERIKGIYFRAVRANQLRFVLLGSARAGVLWRYGGRSAASAERSGPTAFCGTDAQLFSKS